MRIDERSLVFDALIHIRLLIFLLFVTIFAVKVFLPVYRGEIDLEEKVVHVGFESVWVRYIGSALINESFLLHRYHITHVNAYFELF